MFVCFEISDMGYCRSRKVSKFGCGILSWCWLLCACFWCNTTQYLQNPWQLERWVSYPSKSKRPREFPLCSPWKQSWFGKQSSKLVILCLPLSCCFPLFFLFLGHCKSYKSLLCFYPQGCRGHLVLIIMHFIKAYAWNAMTDVMWTGLWDIHNRIRDECII